jgi:pilus assembly protein Flp/PilA
LIRLRALRRLQSDMGGTPTERRAQVLDFLTRVRREDGQAMVEYALILALVSVVAIGVLTTIGSNIVTIFTSVANAL